MEGTKGYIRVAAATPRIEIADVDHNYLRIVSMVHEASEKGADLIVFPELCLTGYTCGDLFRQPTLLDKSIEALQKIADLSDALDITIVVGLPFRHRNRLFNCAGVCAGGRILALVPKTFIPNHNEFYEKRWFSSASEMPQETIRIGEDDVVFGSRTLFKESMATIGIEICEDMWMPVSPGNKAVMAGANIILNLSASNELIGKHDYLLDLIKGQSARNICGYVYASAGVGESTTDLVFAGNAIIAENGLILKESPRFTEEELLSVADIDLEFLNAERINTSFSDAVDDQDLSRYSMIELPLNSTSKIDENRDELLREVNPLPFVPGHNSDLVQRCEEILSIQTSGLVQRLRHTKCRNLVVGISGGLDSTLAILVAVRAFDKLGLDRKGIMGITMPGMGTSDRTLSNALKIMDLLGISSKTISIANAVAQHFDDIDHDASNRDVTYENSQARERTQILMDYANKQNGMVLGTGDLSELALGWCTYNGDHMSMYGVNASIPKTLVRHLVEYIAMQSPEELKRCLADVVDTPISPELIPTDSEGKIAHKTEDLVGPYELHDFFIYQMLRRTSRPEKILALARIAFADKYDDDTIKHWLQTFYRRFFNQQFKRSCMPDGPKVGCVSLSPRGDWRMPSDASGRLWINAIQ